MLTHFRVLRLVALYDLTHKTKAYLEITFTSTATPAVAKRRQVLTNPEQSTGKLPHRLSKCDKVIGTKRKKTRLGQNRVYGWTVFGQYVNLWLNCYTNSQW